MDKNEVKFGERRYGLCDTVPEHLDQCAWAVLDRYWRLFFQCPRKRGYGPGGQYCKQHAKMHEID